MPEWPLRTHREHQEHAPELRQIRMFAQVGRCMTGRADVRRGPTCRMRHGWAPVMSSSGVCAEETFASGAEGLRPTILLVTFDRLRQGSSAARVDGLGPSKLVTIDSCRSLTGRLMVKPSSPHMGGGSHA